MLVWLSLVFLSPAKIESIRFGGCWDPHCLSCPSKASICLDCSDGYVLDEIGDNCIPANHYWSSRYSQDDEDKSFDVLGNWGYLLLFVIFVAFCSYICYCTGNEEERTEAESNLDRYSTNTRRIFAGASNDARENSNHAENSSRRRAPVIPAAFRDNSHLLQTARDNGVPLLSSEEYDSRTQSAALIVDPDGGYHLGIKN